MHTEINTLEALKYKIVVNKYGDKYYYNSAGQRHRENGPAFERANGTKAWYIDGKLHRENGPAFESANGDKEWWINGELHRENGPAIESANGDKEWYIAGRQLTEEEFNARK